MLVDNDINRLTSILLKNPRDAGYYQPKSLNPKKTPKRNHGWTRIYTDMIRTLHPSVYIRVHPWFPPKKLFAPDELLRDERYMYSPIGYFRLFLVLAFLSLVIPSSKAEIIQSLETSNVSEAAGNNQSHAVSVSGASIHVFDTSEDGADRTST